MEIWDKFEAVNDDYLKFELVENKRSKRSDLHAFLLLDELFPSHRDMICNAEHDEFWLEIDNEDIETLTDEQILELTRCGILYDEGLKMLA
jgi:hypothetical protein